MARATRRSAGDKDTALDPYRAKRRADRTPEPMGAGPRKSTKLPSFVIQEHHARALHWDFRLERDGVLVSWALPKGLPVDPKRNHLAVHTEDHPLEYATFAGEIPSGEYGGGAVSIWDRGHYECEKWSEREVMVVLHGSRASGRYVLFQTRGTQWMIHRMDPAPAGWEPLPEHLRPMLCTAGPLPDSDAGWSYECKWDGLRALVAVEGGRVRISSRNDLDVTASYPELRALGLALGTKQLLLDGEIVAFDDEGRTSFGLLQQRMHVADAAKARRLAASVPVSLLIFDVLHVDGRPTLDLPYEERRRLLESLELAGECWATPPVFTGRSGAEVLRGALAAGIEGVVCKRLDSRYLPGRRSDQWRKVKGVRTQEVVIGGYTPGQGQRADTIGALIVGIPGEGGLRYAGKVGTGFSDRALGQLRARLGRLTRVTSPFAGELPRAQVAGATWVRPSLVGEVVFSQWTKDGRMRHPSWRGLRPDKSPKDVVRES
ncbi:MAG TPA: non-homologous end-joining DNA ligase [Acidimicrobiales bacterium]|nr:non-homologous end-joining DNA ligase [Acidimicrobiales bacterium]